MMALVTLRHIQRPVSVSDAAPETDNASLQLELAVSDESDDEEAIYINWNGTNNRGVELPAGIYYYNAVVTFDTLDPKLANQNINGWVQILR